jgi:hypothetical protein
MLVAEALYQHPVTLQTACLRLIKRGQDYLIGGYIGGEDEGDLPAWLTTTTTEADARRKGNHYHAALKRHYGMKRIA